MRDWWQRFAAMPDGQRAVLLLKILGITLIVLLYLLGGASLYLRHRYLDVTPTPPATAPAAGPTAVDTPNQPTLEGVITLTPTPQATLYPTRTPNPASATPHAEAIPATVAASGAPPPCPPSLPT